MSPANINGTVRNKQTIKGGCAELCLNGQGQRLVRPGVENSPVQLRVSYFLHWNFPLAADRPFALALAGVTPIAMPELIL